MEAWKDSGLTLAELAKKANLAMTTVSLGRKLRGEQILTVTECSAIARALGRTVVIGGRRPKAA